MLAVVPKVEKGKRKVIEEDDPSSKRAKGPYETWSSYEDDVILELLAEEAQKGNKMADGQWRRGIWTRVLKEFTERTGTVKTKENVVNRQKTWRKVYQRVNALLATDGFSWDPSSKKLEVEENAWKDYITRHKDAYTFRHHGCRNYELLQIVVGKNISSRSSSITAGSRVLDEAKEILDTEAQDFPEPGDERLELACFMETSGHDTGPEASAHDGTSSESKQRGQAPAPQRRHRTRSHGDRDAAILSAISEISNAIRDLVGNRREVDSWYEALMEVPDLDSDLSNRAVLLLDTVDKKVAFCKKVPEERKKFLEWLAQQ
ncbi:uncharacterized protein At2g29880-like [Aristolochia californica]|uniref:uncharacterized protein At2g29880-like n=1 Tax=Aristolochia californica TaxID=171875 RepID=UPI0035D7F2B1